MKSQKPGLLYPCATFWEAPMNQSPFPARALTAAACSLFVLAAGEVVRAQTGTPAPTASTAAPPTTLYAIKAGSLIDGTGSGPIRNAVVVVENGKITAAGAGVAVPAGAQVIDLSSRTLLPGFIDAHVHLCGRVIGEGSDWQNKTVRDLPGENAIRGARNAPLTLEGGFTTVRMVGADDYNDLALRNTIRDGVVPGPRILAAGHAIGITGGHCDTNGYKPGVADGTPETGVADGDDEIVKAVRLQVKRGADVIKFCATGGVLSEGDAPGVQQYADEEMSTLVKEAHLTGRRVAAHGHGAEGIKAALRAGVDSIEHGSILDDEAIALFKKTGAYLVPTLMAGESVEESAKAGILKGDRARKALYIAPKMRESFRHAAEAGVKVALGTTRASSRTAATRTSSRSWCATA
jgi:imidazolonepropionase-like amidohydrolase